MPQGFELNLPFPSQWCIPASIIIEATSQFSLWLLTMQSFLMTSCLWRCGLSYVSLYLDPGWHLINVWEPSREKGHTRHRRALSSSSQALCARTEHIHSLQLASDPLSLQEWALGQRQTLQFRNMNTEGSRELIFYGLTFRELFGKETVEDNG